MFDIGFWELFFLFLLALFILGPERLPVVASYLGKQFGKVQRYFSNVKNQIDDELEHDWSAWQNDRMGTTLSRCNQKWCDARGTARNHPRDWHLLWCTTSP